MLGRIRSSYRDVREEYNRCRALCIPGRGYCAIARDYGIAPVLLRHFLNRMHQECLDSMDTGEGSSDEDSSMGYF